MHKLPSLLKWISWDCLTRKYIRTKDLGGWGAFSYKLEEIPALIIYTLLVKVILYLAIDLGMTMNDRGKC